MVHLQYRHLSKEKRLNSSVTNDPTDIFCKLFVFYLAKL